MPTFPRKIISLNFPKGVPTKTEVIVHFLSSVHSVEVVEVQSASSWSSKTPASKEQKADIFTKTMDGSTFKRIRHLLQGWQARDVKHLRLEQRLIVPGNCCGICSFR
jgi:hypothetical protein